LTQNRPAIRGDFFAPKSSGTFAAMAIEKLKIEDFLVHSAGAPVFDVRSPGEFAHACIPDAYSFPLFTNEERAVVGTLYKQRSREDAIKTGLDYFGIKMRRMVEDAERLTQQHLATNKQASEKTVLVHCWRGGMRSAAIAWLLDLYGYRVYTLSGGYKSFRKWVIEILANPGPIQILGGYTGSGKTDLLQVLRDRHAKPVVDLEGIAHHKGSAFGAIDMPTQPSQEMFENKLAMAIHSIRSAPEYAQAPIWMEDESQRIGNVNLPPFFWEPFRQQPVVFLDIPFEERLVYLTRTYGRLNKGDIAAAITRIQKRLGGLETKTALGFLVEGDITECFRVLLKYYDRKYGKSLLQRENVAGQIQNLFLPFVHAEQNAVSMLQAQMTIQ
jgi:tRNA 2-selenouridine synthase